MFRTRSLVVIPCVLVAGAVVGGALDKKTHLALATEFSESAVPAPQRSGQRVWHEAAYTREWTVGEEDKPVVFGPLHAKAHPSGGLVVVDYSTMSVTRFTPDGRALCGLGKGRGQGPEEIGNVTDIAFWGTDEILLSDGGNGRILVYDNDCKLVRTVKLPVQPYHLTVTPEREVTMLMTAMSPRLFKRFGLDGQPGRDFGEFLIDQSNRSLALDGWVEPDGADGFVYAGLHAGLLVGYSHDGVQRFAVKTIAPTPLPKLVKTRNFLQVDPEAALGSRSLSVSEGEIHLFTAVQSGIKRTGAIDTYDVRTGAYRYSTKIPESCARILVQGNTVYSVTETTISKWTRVVGPPRKEKA